MDQGFKGRFVSGVNDQYTYFEAPIGIGTSGWTVQRARNATTFTSMTTPTIAELGSGQYALLLDEDMALSAGNQTEQMRFIVTHALVPDPILIQIELFKQNISHQNDRQIYGTGTSGDTWRGTP